MPHVHVHVLPRFRTDFAGNNDDIYPKLEQSEQELRGDLDNSSSRGGSTHFHTAHTQDPKETRVGRDWDVPNDEDRQPRSMEEMEKEARWLAGFF